MTCLKRLGNWFHVHGSGGPDDGRNLPAGVQLFIGLSLGASVSLLLACIFSPFQSVSLYPCVAPLFAVGLGITGFRHNVWLGLGALAGGLGVAIFLIRAFGFHTRFSAHS